MVNFRKITEDNFDAIIQMKRPEDENFVASNAVSLAQAWLYREDGDVFPFAIYDDDTIVGFMLLEEDMEDERLDLWRIMLPPEHEGKGYGTAAIKRMIQYARDSGKYKRIGLLCAPKITTQGTSMISWDSCRPVRSAMGMWKCGWICKEHTFFKGK